MKKINSNCVVCGHPMPDGHRTADCPRCGAPDAFFTNFAGETAHKLWADARKTDFLKWRQRKLLAGQENCRLILGGERVVLLNRENRTMLQVAHYEEPKLIKDRKSFSAGKLHWASVASDGTVTISGDNDYGQCTASGMKGVDSVLVMPRITYLIMEDGTVRVSGVLPRERMVVSSWKDIVSLCGIGKDAVVGLTRSGKLVSTDEMLEKMLASWANVVEIAAAEDYLLALHADGKVSCDGNEAIAKEVAAWPEIIAIAADSQYAVGLTPEGRVLLAGETAFMDMGRLDAKKWEDVVCIAASPHGSLIGGVTADGQLLLAGLAVDGQDMCRKFGKMAPKLLEG